MVKHILQKKGLEIYSVEPETCVSDSLQLMAEKNIGALLVMESGKLVGIFSERDYARKVFLKGKSSLETPVCEIMTEKVYVVNPETSVEECMALMTEKHIRHLPVMKDDQVVGLISIGDVVKEVISKQGFQIAQLESYITGTR